MMPERYVILYRKPAPNVLDWAFEIVDRSEDRQQYIDFLISEGVHQYRTYKLGDAIPAFSSTY